MQLCETLKGTGLFPSKRDLSVRRIPYEGESLLLVLKMEDATCLLEIKMASVWQPARKWSFEDDNHKELRGTIRLKENCKLQMSVVAWLLDFQPVRAWAGTQSHCAQTSDIPNCEQINRCGVKLLSLS